MAEFVKVMEEKKRMCNFFYQCNNCDILREYKTQNYHLCRKFIQDYPQDAEKIIMEWAKNNPIITNADKLREIFPNANIEKICINSLETNFTGCLGGNCQRCRSDFLNSPYEK